MYDSSSAFVLAWISENVNSVIREWVHRRWPLMWLKTGKELCYIIRFCHCSYVANITVLFGGVGVRKLAGNLQKFVKIWWRSWLLELWHRAWGLPGGRDAADSRFVRTLAPSARNTCWTVEQFEVPVLLHLYSFVRSLKSPWAQTQMDSYSWSRASCCWIHVFQSVVVFYFVCVSVGKDETPVIGPYITASMWVICGTHQLWEHGGRQVRPTNQYRTVVP